MPVTSELKQYHPSFICTRFKLFKNGNFLIVGDTPKDCAFLQNESKMKAALGPNVKVSLPQAFHSARKQSHKVLVKGVLTDIKQEEFENMLTQNKITLAKAERFISKRSGTPLLMFLAELKEAATADALIAKNLVGMIFKVEEFRTPPSIR